MDGATGAADRQRLSGGLAQGRRLAAGVLVSRADHLAAMAQGPGARARCKANEATPEMPSMVTQSLSGSRDDERCSPRSRGA